ncbi:MAG: polysaccharide deacetylase family protein [Pseudomonadota bacterium]
MRLLAVLLFVFSFNTLAKDKQMAITIDDLPANTLSRDHATWSKINEQILGALTEFDVQSVGFVNENKLYLNEKKIDRRVDLLRDWLNANQELGNHSFAHLDLHRVESKEFINDIAIGDKVLQQLWQKNPPKIKYFRHPFLHTGRSAEVRTEVEQFLSSKAYVVAPVTIDNQEYIFARAYERASEGERKKVEQDYVSYMLEMVDYYQQQSQAILGYELPQILLLHANQLNGKTLSNLLQGIEQKGFVFVTLEEALKDSAYERADSYYGPGGITWLHRWALTDKMPSSIFGKEPTVPEYIMQLYR